MGKKREEEVEEEGTWQVGRRPKRRAADLIRGLWCEVWGKGRGGEGRSNLLRGKVD